MEIYPFHLNIVTVIGVMERQSMGIFYTVYTQTFFMNSLIYEYLLGTSFIEVAKSYTCI